jgi:hypothetical protein
VAGVADIDAGGVGMLHRQRRQLGGRRRAGLPLAARRPTGRARSSGVRT